MCQSSLVLQYGSEQVCSVKSVPRGRVRGEVLIQNADQIKTCLLECRVVKTESLCGAEIIKILQRQGLRCVGKKKEQAVESVFQRPIYEYQGGTKVALKSRSVKKLELGEATAYCRSTELRWQRRSGRVGGIGVAEESKLNLKSSGVKLNSRNKKSK